MARNQGQHFATPVSPETSKYIDEAANKKAKRNKIISTICTVIGVVLLLVSAGMWGYSQYNYHIQDVNNEKLEKFVEVADDVNKPPVVDWEGLKKQNKDIVGWIYVPGTVINYPVYQGATNNTYLRHTVDGSYGIGGQIFLDSDNEAPGLVDNQSILYGHHLKNGTMFKRIADMDNQQMFDSIKTVWYVTETEQYELKPAFLYLTNPDDRNVRMFNFASDESFQDYLKERFSKAVTKASDAEELIDKATHVLTLSTCNYIDGSGRTELVCVPKA